MCAGKYSAWRKKTTPFCPRKLILRGHYSSRDTIHCRKLLFTMAITIHLSWSLFILPGIFHPQLLFIAGGTIQMGLLFIVGVTIHRRKLLFIWWGKLFKVINYNSLYTIFKLQQICEWCSHPIKAIKKIVMKRSKWSI